MDDVRHSGGIEKERMIIMSNYEENTELDLSHAGSVVIP